MVQSGIRQSGGLGIRSPVHLRSLAFQETCKGLFADYVNTWLKIKQEASGWPPGVGEDETKRQQYLRDYYEHEGIQLEYEKIEKNPGLRTLAKMMLNSMRGKVWTTS